MNTISKLTFFDQPILFIEELESTNDYLKSLLNLNSISSRVIVADYQSKGRGQYGNEWQSEKGQNLILSFSFHPFDFKLENLHLVSESVAITFVEGLNEILIHNKIKEIAAIKWPNDIILKDKKIGGILIETIIREEKIQAIICGIGLNVNQTEFQSNLVNASSLKKLIHQVNWSRELILEKLIPKFEELITQISQIDSIKINSVFNQNLYKFNKEIKLKINNEIETYMNLGINDSGQWKLLIEKSKEIKYINSSRDIEFIY